jgi:hypothetical protein
VEPVADNALVGQVPWQGVNLRQSGHVPVEGGVKAGDLWQVGVGFAGGLNGLEGLGHMIGRERHQPLKRGDEVGRDPLRRSMAAPMHDPMSHCVGCQFRVVALQPAQHCRKRRAMIPKISFLVDYGRALSIPQAQTGGWPADPLDLTEKGAALSSGQFVHGGLEA